MRDAGAVPEISDPSLEAQQTYSSHHSVGSVSRLEFWSSLQHTVYGDKWLMAMTTSDIRDMKTSPPTDVTSDSTEYMEREEDDHSTASTLLGPESGAGIYVDLEKHRTGAPGAETTHGNDRVQLTAWMIVNTLATIGIVSAILSSSQESAY